MSTTSDVTSSSITVLWGTVECIHRNGDITGYSVKYGIYGSGKTHTMYVAGMYTSKSTIRGLAPATNYSIQVAAVSSTGTGKYSTAAVYAITTGKIITNPILLRMYYYVLEYLQ